MKKLLMLILIGLLLTLSIFIVLKGFEVGNIEVLSYLGIQNKSKELDETIQEASKLAEKDYKQALSTVQESSKKLEQTKKKYEDMTAVSSQGDIQIANQMERYEVETLWVKLGNYATSEGAVMRMDIVQGAGNDTYNLKFTVNGSYISITDFISDIENDSTLGFKIEEFKMIPSSSGEDLQATFVCKDIAIKDVSRTSNTNSETTEDKNNTTNSTNSTGSTNSTNTNNNTNNTNATNTTTSNTTNTNANNTNVAK